jgi:hypothetical protein
MSTEPGPIAREIKRLSRADKNIHKGIEYTRRRIANSIQAALAKLVAAGIANPFEYDQCDHELASAQNMDELLVVRNKFLALLRATKEAGKPVEEAIGFEGVQRLLNPEVEDPPMTPTTSTTSTTSNTPSSEKSTPTDYPERKSSFEGGAKRKSDAQRELFTDKPTREKRQLKDEEADMNIASEEEDAQPKKKRAVQINIDAELSFLDEPEQQPLKERLREILKESERVQYYQSLCQRCCQRTKVYKEDYCSPCKRAETNRRLSELRRDQKAKERAVKSKENELIQSALIVKQRHEAEGRIANLETALALLKR